MLSISKNNIITFVAGDSVDGYLFIDCTSDSESTDYKYILDPDDEIYFSIMEPNQKFEEGIIRKIFKANDLDNKGNLHLVLSPSDTFNVLPGNYYYSVKLVNVRGLHLDTKVHTIISNRKLYIL